MKLDIVDEGYEYLAEMAEVDRVKIGGQLYLVNVFGDEGENVPNFHLHPKGGNKKDDVIIRIDKPEYFFTGITTEYLIPGKGRN